MYQKEIKRTNEALIFEHIYHKNQGFSVIEVAQTLDLSFPTVKRIFQYFVTRGILVESQKTGSGVGRKAMEYLFDKDFCYAIGIRITEQRLDAILSNGVGEILQAHSIAFENLAQEDFLAFLSQFILSFLEQLSEEVLAKLMGIGISIPGIFDSEANFIEFRIGQFFPLSSLEDLQEEIPYPLYLENESNLSAIAESILGKYSKLSEFIVLTINKNVGSAHFVRRENDRNFYFKAGRIHHMTVGEEGETCYCGKVGCLGSYVSTKALQKSFQKAFPELQSLEEAFQAKYLESPQGKAIFEAYAEKLAIGLRNLIFFFNPEKVIITGSICRFQEQIYERLLDKLYYDKHIFFRGRDTISFSSFIENSSLIGAALFPIVDALF